MFGKWNGMREHYPVYNIVKMGQNTEKSQGDLKRLAIIQIPEKKSSANTDVKNLLNDISTVVPIINGLRE